VNASGLCSDNGSGIPGPRLACGCAEGVQLDILARDKRPLIRVAPRMMYTSVSDLAACCADSWCYEPLLTRSSLTS
jgi:hypothetical protein